MSDKEEIAISVNNLSKEFLLPHEKHSTVKSAFTNIMQSGKKTVERQKALKDINFEVKKGEFFGIVGRNGSGKSTLLKILAGIYQPTKGSVQTLGKLVPFIELGVGFNPELTGRENVYLNGALLGFSKSQVDEMYEDVVAFAEIERFMDQKLKNYSSGMQVRLAFSLAIRADADILLIDEVLAVGDEAFQRKCFEYFRQLKTAGKTVVFVTHDMSAVQQYCDRAILIEKNQIIYEGKPAIAGSKYSKMLIDEIRKAQVDQPEGRKSKLSPSGEERWGDGMAKWTSVKVVKKNSDEEIVVLANFIALQDIENLIIGFSIKNSNFVQILGTNTERIKAKVGKIKMNESKTVQWTLPNIFNDGRYYVDVTVAHDDATIVSDRWADAAHFDMTRAITNPYLVVVDVKFNEVS